MRALIINDDVRDAIKEMIELARANPVKWESVKNFAIEDNRRFVNLEDRKGYIPFRRSQHLIIPDGYRVAFSFEEQPAGLFRHLSVSVPDRGKFPSVPAVEMIAKEFGLRMPMPDRLWLEEFSPGHHAVNVLHLDTAHSKH